jgi:hypothetical protein|tara:strand:- start:41 stop:430 length:390 start_codon:yes stop_codon:yes gene_type:complete
MERLDKEGESMNLVFGLEHIICTPHADFDKCKPLANVTEFMQWLKKEKHHITIWTQRFSNLESKLKTEKWLKIEQIPYDRLIFDKPRNPVFVNETPANCKYFNYANDVYVVAGLYEEWKEDITQKETKE